MNKFVVLSGWRRILVDPTVVIGLQVAPARLKLVTESPHDVSINSAVVCIHDALADLSELIEREFGRVDRAHTVSGDIDEVCTVWTLHVSLSIHVDTKRLSQVWLGALNPLASISPWRLAVIEVIKPKCAGVSGKRPFAHPYLILVARKHGHMVLVLLANIVDCATIGIPSQVEVVVDNDVVCVGVGEEVIPV